MNIFRKPEEYAAVTVHNLFNGHELVSIGRGDLMNMYCGLHEIKFEIRYIGESVTMKLEKGGVTVYFEGNSRWHLMEILQRKHRELEERISARELVSKALDDMGVNIDTMKEGR